jgi:hypothetical protein
MATAAEHLEQAVGERRRRITPPQWVFAVLAPILCIGVDAVCGGVVMSAAPVALWSLAIIGPAVLVASAQPFASQARRAAFAGLAGACALCAWASLIGGLAYALITSANVRHALTSAWGILLVVIVPLGLGLIACGRVYWRRARILLAGGNAQSPWMFATGVGLIAALLAMETADRGYFAYRLRQLESRDVQLVASGARGLAAYPLRFTFRIDDACFALFGQRLERGSYYDASEPLHDAFLRRYGDQASAVREAAAPLFGSDPVEACATEL